MQINLEDFIPDINLNLRFLLIRGLKVKFLKPSDEDIQKVAEFELSYLHSNYPFSINWGPVGNLAYILLATLVYLPLIIFYFFRKAVLKNEPD